MYPIHDSNVCLDWQPSQFINIVGKDDRAGMAPRGILRGIALLSANGRRGGAIPPFPAVLPSHSTNCLRISFLPPFLSAPTLQMEASENPI